MNRVPRGRSLSDQLQEAYCKDNSHGGAPGGVVHEVRVLQTNSWPDQVRGLWIFRAFQLLLLCFSGVLAIGGVAIQSVSKVSVA